MILRRNKRLADALGPNTLGTARPVLLGGGQSLWDGSIDPVNLESQYRNPYPLVRFTRKTSDLSLQLVPLSWADETTYKAGNPASDGYFACQFYCWPQVQALLNREIVVIHHALGGTALNGVWKPTATVGQMYKDWVYKTKTVINLITSIDGIAPDVRGAIWEQGTNDARNLTDANAYQTNLSNFFTNFRSDTGLSTLRFFVGLLNTSLQFATSPTHPYWLTVRNAQIALCQGGGSAMSGVFGVDQENCTMASDFIHRDQPGYMTASNNYISSMQSNGAI